MSGDTRPAQERRAIDTTVAHSARVHDYWLGGKDNHPADRAVAESMIAQWTSVTWCRPTWPNRVTGWWWRGSRSFQEPTAAELAGVLLVSRPRWGWWRSARRG
jgi:hypothetical protein